MTTMLIATFGATTAWAGKRITQEGKVFVLEGHGPITAADVMEYDRQGHLVWVNEGTRGWVGSKAKGSRTRSAVAAAASESAMTSTSGDASSGVSSASLRTTAYLKRALLVVIGILVVANVVLILIAAGVFR